MSSVRKAVALRAGVSGVSSLRPLRMRPVSCVECEHHQYPRDVLALTMMGLRRAAEARKGKRIVRRLAALGEGKVERVTWSSRTSLRGVC